MRVKQFFYCLSPKSNHLLLLVSQKHFKKLLTNLNKLFWKIYIKTVAEYSDPLLNPPISYNWSSSITPKSQRFSDVLRGYKECGMKWVNDKELNIKTYFRGFNKSLEIKISLHLLFHTNNQNPKIWSQYAMKRREKL